MLFSIFLLNFYKNLMGYLWCKMVEWLKEGLMGRDEGGLGWWVCVGIIEINEWMNVRMGELMYE